ncbi:MAG TPA: Fe-S cluster assembly protein HesB [Armatimonadota bacterium]|nr:Fe-S cluster assembly protein HesB [Armatimonadota bacterium]
MPHLLVPATTPFHFRDVVFSHGWLRLPPYHWDAETEVLSRIERLPSGRLVRMRMSAAPGGVLLHLPAPPEEHGMLIQRARWMLALDDRFDAFHALCAADPGLRAAAEQGQGRILRCPTVWEDLVKTLFSVNTTWRQTVAMTSALVALCGDLHPDGARAFPEPVAVAALDPGVLQESCRVGYRAEALSRIARDLAESRLDLEALKDASRPDEEVEARLRSLRGIGPYATANVMMLLGRYDHLPVDSWFRKTVRDGWFGGRAAPDRELVAAFDRYRPYRTLVYRFYDWEGAMRTSVWTGQG